MLFIYLESLTMDDHLTIEYKKLLAFSKGQLVNGHRGSDYASWVENTGKLQSEVDDLYCRSKQQDSAVQMRRICSSAQKVFLIGMLIGSVAFIFGSLRSDRPIESNKAVGYLFIASTIGYTTLLGSRNYWAYSTLSRRLRDLSKILLHGRTAKKNCEYCAKLCSDAIDSVSSL